MGSEHFKGHTISIDVCENGIISTKLSHLRWISTFWLNLDYFETTNKGFVLSLRATVYGCMGRQLHKGAWPRGKKLAHALLAKLLPLGLSSKRGHLVLICTMVLYGPAVALLDLQFFSFYLFVYKRE